MSRRAIPILLLLIVFSMLSPIARAQDLTLELSFDDPEGDNSKFNTTSLETEPIGGYENIDIVHIASKEADEGILPIDTPGIDLPPLKDTYQLIYSSGICLLYGEGTNEPCASTIEENHTLNLYVDTDSIGDPSQSFNFSAASLKQLSDDEMVMDSAPSSGGSDDSQKIIEITSPTDGATIWDDVSILGRTTGVEGNIQKVEVMIEEVDDDLWLLATSYDGWSTWLFEWDTTGVEDGTYTFKARAYDGESNHEESIELWVDQDSKTDPPSFEMPQIPVGAKFIYKESTRLETMGMSLTGNMEGEVIFHGNSTVEIEGEPLPARTSTLYAAGDLLVTGIVGISAHILEEGRSWYQREDLSIMRSEAWANTSLPEIGDVNGHTVTTYDPPMLQLKFPLSVGDQWMSHSQVTIESEANDEESTQEQEVDASYEALHIEKVTVEAGTFETIVVREELSATGSSESLDIDMDHTLIYYSPDLGYRVKEVSYDSDGDVVAEWELVDHTVDLNATHQKDPDPSGTVIDGQGFSISFQDALFFFILPLAIFMMVMVSIRKRRKAKKASASSSPDISDSLSGLSQVRSDKNGTQIECPSCGAILIVETDGKDGTITCSNCGAEGTLDS